MKAITIAGNVTRDAEIRNAGGNTVCGFSIAVNGFSGGQKTTTFFDVSIWGKRGEAAKQFATKGAKMTVTGDFGHREHNGKTYFTVNAYDFTPMGGGDSQGSGNSGYGAGGSANSGGYGGDQHSGHSRDLSDEIPF